MLVKKDGTPKDVQSAHCGGACRPESGGPGLRDSGRIQAKSKLNRNISRYVLIPVGNIKQRCHDIERRNT